MDSKGEGGLRKYQRPQRGPTGMPLHLLIKRTPEPFKPAILVDKSIIILNVLIFILEKGGKK